jgi:hypothetical protein
VDWACCRLAALKEPLTSLHEGCLVHSSTGRYWHWIADFYASILHLLGIDHEQLTNYHNGIERRLTDVHGQVIQDILA